MSKGINKAILLGNVGNAPEIRLMPGGDKVANFSVATSETWTDKQNGQRQERTEWHKVSAFGALAIEVENYVKKGTKLYIEGKFRTRSWQEDGITRYVTEVSAQQLQLLDSKQSQAPAPPVDAYADDIPQASSQATQAAAPRGYNENGTQKSPYANN